MAETRASGEAGRGTTARVQLARAARGAALGVPGVAGLGPGARPDRSTRDGGELIEGVVAAAEPGGRYELTLYIGAEPVPLQDLGERVRAAVAAAARRAGLADDLGTIHVAIEDLVERGAGS